MTFIIKVENKKIFLFNAFFCFCMIEKISNKSFLTLKFLRT